ncbi:MAG: GDSL-type esterase/lipase family protein [Dehalococcoidia bacterium]
MVILAAVVGLLAILAATGVTLFTVGEVPAAAVAALLVVAVFYVLLKLKHLAGKLVLLMAVVAVASLGYGGWSAFQVARSLTGTGGEVDPADPTKLAAANEKIDSARGAAGFRVELSEEELAAVLQDALAGNDDNPLRNVTLTLVGGEDGGPGHIDFRGTFKRGSTTAKGRVEAKAEDGRVEFSLKQADLGSFKMPGLARGALNDLVETITDLNSRLEEQNADVQLLEIRDGVAVIAGVQGDGDLVTLGSVLDSVRENIAGLGAAAKPPAEVLGPGRVNGTEQAGDPVYVALGDSLAANVGVSTAKEGYVSRVHKALEAKEGATYGLRNFGRSGETSNGLIRNQLDEAVKFMGSRSVAFVTVDIGANDLLGHLYSADCSETLETPACVARLESTKVAYRANLKTIISRLKKAAPRATIVFLGTYNPFSIGFGSGVKLEGQTDEIVDEVNAIAKEVVESEGALFADGQGVIKGRAGAVTHMLDNPADIHPRAIGYDLLAQAVMAALK